jgi:hypothetical protein
MPIVVDFARAVRPKQAEDFARLDVEVDSLHRLDSAGIRLRKSSYFDCNHRYLRHIRLGSFVYGVRRIPTAGCDR